jgi:hypothetical protein
MSPLSHGWRLLTGSWTARRLRPRVAAGAGRAVSVPELKTREEYRAYMAERRAAHEAAAARSKTTSGPPIALSEIRRFQAARGSSTATKADVREAHQ